MTQRSISETQPHVKSSELPPARNRRLLLTSWQRGVRVLTHWGGRYTVSSASNPHRAHQVTTWQDSDGTRYEACTCEWGRRHGEVATFNRGTAQRSTNGVLPCGHILVVRWVALDSEAQAAILAKHADLAAVLGPVVPACPVGFAPIMSAPHIRRERSRETW